jgi:hypothetical protein
MRIGAVEKKMGTGYGLSARNLRLAGPKKEKGTQAVGRKSSGPEKSE